MRKLLLFTIDFAPRTGGVANYYKNICSHLPCESVAVLTNNEAKDKEFDSSQEYTIYRKNLLTPLPIWPKWAFSFFYLRKIIKKEKVEVVLVGQILPLGAIAYIYKKLFKMPYGVSIHGMDIMFAKRSHRKTKLASKILKNAEFVIVNSNYTKKLVLEWGVDDSKITVVYPGVDDLNLENCKNMKGGKNGEFSKILLTIGRLVKRKGQDMVIKALPRVLRVFPYLKYVIVGEGPDRDYLANLAKINKVEKNVVFMGRVADEDLPCYYKNSDIFIMISRDIYGDVEGFGIVYLEAALYKKPVIAGNSGGAGEAVLHNKTGLLVNPEKEEEIVDAIVELLKNKELANKLGVQGRERVLSEFTWTRQIGKIKNIIKS